MHLRCRLIALAAGFTVAAAAADPDMMNLVLPDATFVMEIKMASIMASQVGTAIGQAMRQGISTQLQSEAAKAKPELQDKIAALGRLEWADDVQDIVIAGGMGKGSPILLIVRSSLDLARLKALGAFAGGVSDFEGVPILVSDKSGDGVVAFLPGSILLIGKAPDVEAAIHRRGQPAALSSALAAEVGRYSHNDIWVASVGVIPQVPVPAGAKNPAAAGVVNYLSKIAGFNGGIRLSPDFDLSLAVSARTAKDAAEMAGGLRWITAQSKGQLDSFKYELEGKRIHVSLHVPEKQIRAALDEQKKRLALQPKPAPAEAISRPVPNGMPPPPPGTIRVQSSEGTVLIPVH